MFNLDDLNSRQKEAVIKKDGAILMLAGAGSGKTRSLTHRVFNLIKGGVNPKNILAITFTNKATNEMRERLHSFSNEVTISTFHSLCVKILREFIYALNGYNHYFTIYNEDDKNKLIKNIIKEFNYNPEELYKDALFHISNAKNIGETPDEYLNNNFQYSGIKEIYNIYVEYEKQLKNNNAFDFDDLLIKTYQLLSDNSKILEILQDRYLYIHVDEFQDTNIIQYKILKLLAAKHKNIFVVGDEDQCIYSWRGASIINTQSFVDDFKPVVIKLEQNYRSTKNIIETANKLIKNNIQRIEKSLWTENEDGEKVKYYQAHSDIDEAEYVSRNIYNLINNYDYRPSDIVILYRMSALSRLMEEKLINYNIPFVIYGGFKFFERVEVKNLLAYMWLLYNPSDNENLKKIINYPKRGIGLATTEKLEELSKIHNIPIFNVIININNFNLGKATTSKLMPLKELLSNISALKEQNLNLQQITEKIIQLTQIREFYSEKSEENLNRLLNIGQLQDSIKSFEVLNENAELVDYLQSISLQSSVDNEETENISNCVVLSTIHACKGLEFKAVFIVGVEEGLFPISKAFSDSDMEEERRLMYVAVTRSQKLLTITGSETRFLYNARNAMRPSRFLKEMDLISTVNAEYYASYKKYENSSLKSFNEKANSSDAMNNYAYTNEFTGNNIQEIINAKLKKQGKDYSRFKVGLMVLHPKFGIGTITKSNLDSGNNSVEVSFTGIGVKVLNLDFAPLQIIEKK